MFYLHMNPIQYSLVPKKLLYPIDEKGYKRLPNDSNLLAIIQIKVLVVASKVVNPVS